MLNFENQKVSVHIAMLSVVKQVELVKNGSRRVVMKGTNCPLTLLYFLFLFESYRQEVFPVLHPAKPNCSWHDIT